MVVVEFVGVELVRNTTVLFSVPNNLSVSSAPAARQRQGNEEPLPPG